MKKHTLQLAAFAAALSLSHAAHSDGPFVPPSDAVQIEKLERAFGKATRFEHVERMFAPNAVLIDVFSPGFYRGRQNFRAALEWQWEGMTSIDNSFQYFSIMRHGNLACAASTQVSIAQTGGQVVPSSFIFTDVLKKTDGYWNIIVNHAAFPIDPKTWSTTTGKPLSETQPVVVHEADWFSGPAVPVAQAKKELRKWADDLYAVQTAEAATRFYDPEVTLFSALNPNVYHGRDQVIQRFREDMKGIKSIKVRERESGIETDGVLGVVWSLQDLDLVMDNGEKQKMNVRQLDCLRRKDGQWLAVHEIISFPVDTTTWKGIPLLQYGDKPVPKAGTGNVHGPAQ